MTMTRLNAGDAVTVCSRYWLHDEPGQVVKVGRDVIQVEAGGHMFRFDADTRQFCDAGWGSSVWFDVPDVTASNLSQPTVQEVKQSLG